MFRRRLVDHRANLSGQRRLFLRAIGRVAAAKTRPEQIAMSLSHMIAGLPRVRVDLYSHSHDFRGKCMSRVAALMDRAQQQTGLGDFGADGFREGLEILVASLDGEAHLNDLGRLSLDMQ